jgi:hypothetical protein
MSASPVVSKVEFAFPPLGAKKPAVALERISQVAKLAEVTPASQLSVRPSPEMALSGVRELDGITGGIPRGCLTEICGSASSGRTSVLLSVLAAATGRQETCALVDAGDTFDPKSAAKAGVDFERLLWIRCDGRTEKAVKTEGNFSAKRTAASVAVEQAMRVADLLLQSGGFGLVVFDLGSIPVKIARRIPLASWFRFQRVVERTPTIFFVITPVPCAQTCATLLWKVQGKKLTSARTDAEARNKDGSVPQQTLPAPAHAELLDGLSITGELLRSRLERKPMHSVKTQFVSKAG